jgi:hypothetical protein
MCLQAVAELFTILKAMAGQTGDVCFISVERRGLEVLRLASCALARKMVLRHALGYMWYIRNHLILCLICISNQYACFVLRSRLFFLLIWVIFSILKK